MLYGIGAFVFLVSLWGIVNMVVTGLNINQEQSLCPDYLGGWCGNKSATSGTFPSFPVGGGTNTGNTNGGNTGGTNTGTGGGATGSTTGSSNLSSALTGLVFGSYKDVVSFGFNSGAPRAAASVPAISDTAACTSAISTLRLASDVENVETAYLLYTDNGGVTHFSNVTDLTFKNGVSYDDDTINTIVGAGATDLYLIHTHQKDNTEAAGLIANGYPPSAADMTLMCDNIVSGMTHVIIDWGNVWVMNQPAGTCPRRSDETDKFAVIETLAMLSQVVPGDRNQEYADLMNSRLLTNQYKVPLQAFAQTSFDGMSSTAIFDLTIPYQNQAGLSISRTDMNGFCQSL